MEAHDYRITNYGYIHSHKEDDFKVFLDTIDPQDGEKILEAFCGYGETTQRLLSRESTASISCQHYLSDISEVQLNRAKESLQGQDNLVSIDLADALKLPYADNFFDKVVVKMGLHEGTSENQKLMARELTRVLKKGGKFVTWEIALPEDKDIQRVFKEVIYKKNSLAGFYEINRRRYFQTETTLKDLLSNSGLQKVTKVHDIWYTFESIRRKEEMVSTERKLIQEAFGEVSDTHEEILLKLSNFRLEEFNKSIQDIITPDLREKLQYKEEGQENITFLAHKAIMYGIKE